MPAILPGADPSGIVFQNPADLITKALKKCRVVGFGRDATSEEITDGMQSLNILLDELSIVRTAITVRKSEQFPLVVRQNIYGIGPSSTDFDTVRPIKIEQAWYLSVDGKTTYPLDVTMIEQEYGDIMTKDIQAMPSRLFYKADWPLGVITFDYLPDQAYTLVINSWKPYEKINDPGDGTQLGFPDGFESMLVWNLADVLGPENGKPVDGYIHDKAMSTLSAINAAYGEAPKVTSWDIPGSGGTITNGRSLFGG